MNQNRIPVLIDTDIGDDIDDAFALCLAMKSPEIDILGVTTVFKNTTCRARLAKKLLSLGGFDHVPVYAGASLPLISREVYNRPVDFTEKPISYTDDLNNVEIDTSMDGAEFIIHTLEKSNRPVVIVTLGALTNLADAFRRRPDIRGKIDYISMMGGAFFQNRCEYNYSCDPQAADMVLCSGVKIQAVGLDVTFQCKPSKEQLDMLAQHAHPCIRMLMSMRKSWAHDVFLHDPLALAAVYDKSCLTFKNTLYRVETRGEFTQGMVINVHDHNMPEAENTPHVDVAVSVDADNFVNMCTERLLSF
jgi:purine nucleosidase/pyrimidine-specific ribonucleoside hydrolase